MRIVVAMVMVVFFQVFKSDKNRDKNKAGLMVY